MKKIIYLVFFVLFGTLFFSQCKHEPNEVELQPVIPIDTSDTNQVNPYDTITWPVPSTEPRVAGTWYFENDIKKLLVSKCAMETWNNYPVGDDNPPETKTGCHSSNHKMENIILDNYDDVRFGTAKESGDVVPLIVPFNTDSSFLYEIINKKEMPINPAASMLPTEITMIKEWIEQGALNNRCEPCDSTTEGSYVNVRKILYDNCGGCHNDNMVVQNTQNTVSYFLGLNTTPDKADYARIAQDAPLIYAKMRDPHKNKVMPKILGRLYKCEVDVFKKWMDNGKPQ